MNKNTNIISRQQAKASGFKRYFTGIPCKHDHIAERYTSHSHCCVCDRISRAKYRQLNRDVLRERGKRYRKKLKDLKILKEETLTTPQKQEKQVAQGAKQKVEDTFLSEPIWKTIDQPHNTILQKCIRNQREYLQKKKALR